MTHPLAALIAGVTRFNIKTGENTDPSVLLLEAEVLAALEAAPVPDLVEAGKVVERLENVDPFQFPFSAADAELDAANTLRALIALATAQAAQIAGLEDKLAFVQRREIASNTEFDEVWSEAQADAATLRAEVERLRGALEKINVGEGWAAKIAREALKEAGHEPT